MNSRDDLEKQRINNRDIAGEGVNDNIAIMNGLGEGVRNTAFTLSIFLFTFSSPIFVDFQELGLTCFDKTGLFISWVFLFFSILSGLVQVLLDLKFHRRMLLMYVKRDNIWADLLSLKGYEKEFQEKYKASTSLYDSEKPSDSPTYPTVFQIIFLLLGFISILMVATRLLF